MRRRVVLAAALVAAAVAALASPAIAAPRYHTGRAMPIYHRKFSLSAGAHTFQTVNLQPIAAQNCTSPNTFLVVKRASGASYSNDDCPGGGPASCVTVPSMTAGTWTATIFASPGVPDGCGRTDLRIDGVTVDTAVKFGGTTVTLSASELPPATYDVQTVHLPGGALDTVLGAWDAGWQELGYNDLSGVGLAARLPVTMAAGGTLRLVFGSFGQTGDGLAALVANECLQRPDEPSPLACNAAGHDADRDSLSNLLEFELATNRLFHDTDRDGLFDYYEVYGRRIASGSIELPRMGANPRRRDVFIEADRERVDINNPNNPGAGVPGPGSLTCPPPSSGSMLRDRLPLDQTAFAYSDNADYLRDVLLDLPRLAPNPDGTNFVQVHVDGGGACSDATLCGNWGGSQLLQKPIGYNGDAAAVAPNFAEVRRGLFKYVWYTCGGAGTGNKGYTFRAESVSIVAHELGHSYGLQHWGLVPAGFSGANHRAYPSIMNYLYSYSLPGFGIPTARSRFSEGTMPSLDAPVSEFGFLQSTFAPHLTLSPFRYTVSGNDVDLNRDGRFSDSVLVDSSPANVAYHGEWPDALRAMLTQGDLPASAPSCIPSADGACHPSGGPAITVRNLDGTGPESGRRTKVYAYVPFRHGIGLVYPDLATHIEDIDAPDQSWTAFSAGVSFFGNPVGEPAARILQTPPKALVLFPSINGVLHWRWANPDVASTTPWQPIPNWPAGLRARSASIAGGVASSAGLSPVIWIDSNDPFALNGPNVWEAWFDPLAGVAGAWTTPVRTNASSLGYTPGIAIGPDQQYYMAAPGYFLDVLRRTGNAQWTSVLALSPADQISVGNGALCPSFDAYTEECIGRLNLEVVPLRTGDGGVFADGSAQFSVFWSSWGSATNSDSWFLRRATQQGYISPTALVFTKWTSRRTAAIDRPYPYHSVATTRRYRDVSVIQTGSTFNTSTIRNAMFVPNATGAIPGYRGHVDTDDAAVISGALCETTWSLVKGANAACYCQTQANCLTPPFVDPPLPLPTDCPPPPE